jgi:3-phenylpropionate/cinnamic acid dioxygenase small subunit
VTGSVRVGVGGAVAVTAEEAREIEAFVHREARLADESRYDEWEALLTDDVHYWVPAGRAEGDPAAQVAYINDNRARLATRLRQLRSGKRHAQTPPSPMRRIVSNIEVLEVGPASGDEADGTEYRVTSNFVLYELAVQATGSLRVWPGRTLHLLRRVDGELRMAAKTVELVTATQPQPNLTFLL